MCGIAGGWWRPPLPDIDRTMREAVSAMRRRGPNDQGYESGEIAGGIAALGHTRLSVIDLSARGHQPMHSADQKVSIVFNGEIYNYRELRTELIGMGRTFTSDSDTEVLLAAWRQWGRACLPRLVGMFAFAVLDRASGTLTCVRDGFGIKPLFYSRQQNGFLFGSEMAAIKALKQGKVSLDWQQAHDYLVYGSYDSSRRTFLQDVFSLPPGYFLTLDVHTGRLSEPEQWWRPDIAERETLTFEQAAEQLRDRFLRSIRFHLRSDVPLGAALSGGIDSSAVVCAMRHLEPDLDIKTFSFIARGSSVSEERWVDEVNRHVRAVPHKVVVSADELAADIDDLIRSQGEPFGSTSIYAQYRVFRMAKEHGVTVTLDGQGADELLAGYHGYPGQRLHSLIETGRFIEAWRFLGQWANWPGRNRFYGAKRAVAELTHGPVYRGLRRLSDLRNSPVWIDPAPLREKGIVRDFPSRRSARSESGRRVAAALAAALTQQGLPQLLRHGDRNSMRFSVESRVPFLTVDMADFLLSLPESYLISSQGETKRIFRAAMRGIVPDSILDRRDKIGFSTPEKDWLLSAPEMIRGWLSPELNIPFFKQHEVLREFDLIVADKKPFSWQVWRWINFSRWYCHFVM